MVMGRKESRLDRFGRLLIPAQIRKQLGLTPGTVMLLRVEDNGIRLISIEAARRQAQEMVLRHIPPNVSLVEDLFAERKLDSQRE